MSRPTCRLTAPALPLQELDGAGFMFAFLYVFLVLWAAASVRAQELGATLPGTRPLTMTGDLASEMVAGADRFLVREIAESAGKREKYWKRDFSSAAYQASVEPNRRRWRTFWECGMLGWRLPSVFTGLTRWISTRLMMIRCEARAIESGRQRGPRSEM